MLGSNGVIIFAARRIPQFCTSGRCSSAQEPRWHNLASSLPVMFCTPRHQAKTLSHRSRPNARMKRRPRHRSTANFKCFFPMLGKSKITSIPAVRRYSRCIQFALCCAKDIPAGHEKKSHLAAISNIHSCTTSLSIIAPLFFPIPLYIGLNTYLCSPCGLPCASGIRSFQPRLPSLYHTGRELLYPQSHAVQGSIS